VLFPNLPQTPHVAATDLLPKRENSDFAARGFDGLTGSDDCFIAVLSRTHDGISSI
jgi:hypothetical protein